MRNQHNKLRVIVILFSFGLLSTYVASIFTDSQPVHAQAVTTNSASEYSVTSYSYPGSTISGISAPIPDNAVVTEIGYGSDDHDFYMAAQEGKFYQKAGGGWGVQPVGYKSNSSGVERRGVFVSLNSDSQWNAPADTYMTRWGWASSPTSGGNGNDDSHPVNVCVDVKYKLFDANTHVINDSQTYESGNCSAMGYQVPGWIRGLIQADPGTFITDIGQFQFGNDAKLQGAQGFFRKIESQTLDAQYISDTIPRSPLAPSSNQQDTITMKNTGTVIWTGDNYNRTSGNCDNFPVVDGNNPTPEGATCTETYQVSSSTFKLRRTDTDNRINAPAELDFVINASRTLRATSEPIITCTDPGDGGGGIIPLSFSQQKSIWQKLTEFLVPSAHANIVPPGDGGGEVCTETGRQIVGEVISSDSFNIAPGQSATFPITFTTQSSNAGGPVNLQYKMVKKSGANPNPSDVMFGDTATMPVTVANGPSLNCSAYVSVSSGDIADFAVSASGASSPVSVTMTSNPSGPTMSNSPLTLNDGNSYASIGHVPTSGLNTGDYVLTFNGDNGSSCQSQLNITAPAPTATIYFDESRTPTPPNKAVGYNGTIRWESTNATSCDAVPASGTNWGSTNGGANIGTSGSIQSGALNTPSTYTFTIRCTGNGNPPATSSVNVDVSNTVGGSPSVDIKCMGKNDSTPTEPSCIIDRGSYAMLTWTTSGVNACSIDQGFGNVALENDPPGSTTGNLNADVTRFTLSCTGPSNPPSNPKTDYVDIHTDVPPDAPQLSADNVNCGTVILSWKVVSGNDPASFHVYHRMNPSDQWAPLTTTNFTSRGATYTYTHSPSPLDVTHYYAVAAVSAGGSESPYAIVQTVPTSCRADLGGSDKDIIAVAGRITKDYSSVAIPCSGDSEIVSLPNNALFGINDKVTFQLNICSTGSEDLTNVSVTDTPINLTNLTYVSSTNGTSPCTDKNRFNYNATNNTLTITTDNVPAGLNATKYCTVVYKATVTAPQNPTTDIYRFQNKATIHASGLTAPANTPPYLFTLSGGVPNRNETAPSH